MGRYQRWLATVIDNERIGTSPRAWGTTGGLVLLILILASFVSPIVDWFHLDFWPALACFAPSFLLGFGASLVQKRRRIPLQTFGILALMGCALLQFFFAALIALSSPPGSFVLASLLLLTLAFHGYVTRATIQYPYMLACSIAALAAGCSVRPTHATLALFAFIAPIGMLVNLMSGQVGLREHQDRLERDKLRQAIHYKAMSERIEAHSQMSRRVMNLLSYNHDAGNVLSTVFLNAQLLEERVATMPASALDADVARQIAKFVEPLARLKSLISRGHEIAEEMTATSPTPLLAMLDEVANDCRALFPSVAIRVHAAGAPRSLAVCVQEGAIGLRRILENVLRNACEGNGTEGAREIRVEVDSNGNGVSLRCIDDGPGFRPDWIGKDLVPFQTTKIGGHGLGLFSVSHLVQASGGEIHFANYGTRGAVVDVHLQCDQGD